MQKRLPVPTASYDIKMSSVPMLVFAYLKLAGWLKRADPHRKWYWSFQLLVQTKRFPGITLLRPWDSLWQLSNSLVENVLIVFQRMEAIRFQVDGVQQQGCLKLHCCSDSSQLSLGWQQLYFSCCLIVFTVYSSHRSLHDFRAMAYGVGINEEFCEI